MEEATLSQDELFDNAEDKLKSYVLGKNYENKYNNAKVDYDFDNSDGSRNLRVTYNKTNIDTEVKYVYTHTPKLISSNNKDVTDLLNLMLNGRNKPLSKKELKDLSKILEKLDDKELKLDGKCIVETKEIDDDLER